MKGGKIKVTEEEFIIPELDKLAETYVPKNPGWTHKAEQIVLKYYDKLSLVDLQKYLAKHYPPKRTTSAIQNKYYILKAESK